MVAALWTAFFLSVANTLWNREYVYFDSLCAIIFLLLIGRFVQGRAMRRAQRECKKQWGFFPLQARLITPEGVEQMLSVRNLTPGMIVRIKAQERVSADIRVTIGNSSLDRSVLTGEPVPVAVGPRDVVEAGELNIDAEIEGEVLRCGAHTRIGSIQHRLESEALKKPEIQEFLDRVAKYYTAGLCLAAALIVYYWYPLGAVRTLEQILALSMVACPCALAFAVPLTLSVALSRAAQQGIMIRSPRALEALTSVSTAVLDKTGTLTRGEFRVARELGEPLTAQSYAVLSALCAASPNHPVARAVQAYCAPRSAGVVAENLSVRVLPGKGAEATLAYGVIARIGSERYMREQGFRIPWKLNSEFTYCFFALESEVKLAFELEDQLDPGAQGLADYLADIGWEVCIFSGDRTQAVQHCAAALGVPLSQAFGDCSPEEKAEGVQRVNPCLMVGDGMNDALALSRAHVAIGMQGGMQAVLEVADIFIAKGGMEAVERCVRGAFDSMRSLQRILIFSAAYNVLGACAAIAGLITPLWAALLMPISSIIVILNALYGNHFWLKEAR